jgi:apolipoprotein N-acyltransferase
MEVDEQKENAMTGISYAALGGAALLIMMVLALVVLAIYNKFGFSPNMFFWVGVLSFIVVVIAYPAHMATENKVLLAVTGIFGAMGIISIYASISARAGPFDDKITPILLFSIIVIILLLIVFAGAKSAGDQKRREALRKKT